MLYKVDRLGDFILATGALRLLVEHFGAAECRLIVSNVAAPLAAAEFPDVAQWVAPAELSGVWREIRPCRLHLAPTWATECFDHLISLRHARSLYRDVSLNWIHADRWHGLGPRPTGDSLAIHNRPVLAENYPTDASAPWCRELAAHRQALSTVLGRTPSWDELRPRLRHLIPSEGDELVFCPFGGDDIRDYPLAHWLTAWREARVRSVPIHLVGPGRRRSDLIALADGLRAFHPTGVSLSIDLPPATFIERVARARAVICVESAAAHLATAFDKNAVILTGGGHFGWIAPWGDGVKQRWLSHPLPCFGCNWVCHRPSVECLTLIPPASVAAAIEEMTGHA